MAVVSMKFVTLAAPVDKFDTVVHSCVVNRQIHLESAQQVMRANRRLQPFTTFNPYAALFRQAEALASRLGYTAHYVPFEAMEFNQEKIKDYFSSIDDTLSSLEQQWQALNAQTTNDRSILNQMKNLTGIDADLAQLRQLKFLRFRFGHMTRETYDSFYEKLESRDDLFFLPTKIEPAIVYGAYFTSKQSHDTVDSLFNSLHFVRVDIDDRADGTTEDTINALIAQIAATTEASNKLKRQITGFGKQEEQTFLAAYSYLRWWNETFEVRRCAAHSKANFYLVGWIPEHELKDMTARFDACEGLSYVLEDATDQSLPTPPTLLKQCTLAKIFQPFLLMYGLPAYNEMDPSTFMAFTYCLFAGIMFGDVGQGICLILAGLALWKYKKMWLGQIIACCGVSSTIFGFVYGNIFGFEHILPGFKVLEGQNVIYLLLASVAMGVVMILIVMAINIANGIRQRNYEKWLFGPNGVAGLLFYFGLIAAAVSAVMGGPNLFKPIYVLPVLVLPLVLIALREPLGKLALGDPDFMPESIGGLLATGFFELFETLLSYLTNTISFMRIGAYAITHVGLMMVVHMMAGADLSPVVLVLGNLFVMGFEGLLVGIQVLRLEFYELFGRFYDDGGREYKPQLIDYSARNA